MLNRHLKYLAIGTLVLYFVLGAGLRVFVRDDIYPIFSWNLFSYIPNDQYKFSLRVLSYGTDKYTPPKRFDEMATIFEKIHQPPTEYVRDIDQMGYALQGKDTDKIARIKTRLDTMFYKTPATYEITKVRYNPVEFWRTRSYISEVVLITFDTTKTP